MAALANLLPSSIQGSITPGHETILSIFPAFMESQSFHAGMYKYIHPPADRSKIYKLQVNPKVIFQYPAIPGEPMYNLEVQDVELGKGYTLLEVYDTYQMCMDFTAEPVRPIKRDIPAKAVADSLVKEWTNGRLSKETSGGPGILLLDPRKTFDDQLRYIWEVQDQYFHDLVIDAIEYTEKKEYANITNLHRIAAEYRNYTDLPFARGQKIGKPLEVQKECAACGKSIPKMALVCSQCGTNIIIFAKQMKEHGIDIQDPALEAVTMKFPLTEKPKK